MCTRFTYSQLCTFFLTIYVVCLEMPTIESLVDYIPRMCAKWEFIAVKLGVKELKEDLATSQQPSDSKCLHVLQAWIDKGWNVKWLYLIEVLRSPSVGLGSLADEIASKSSS